MDRKNTYNKIKIGIDGHVLNTLHKGSVSVLSNFISELSNYNYQFIIYSYDPGFTEKVFDATNIIHKKIPFHNPFIRIPIVYPYLYNRYHCNILHMDYFGPIVGVKNLVLTIHDLIYLDYPQFSSRFGSAKLYYLCRLSAKNAKKIITVSNYSKSRIIDIFKIPEERVKVIYNGLNDNWKKIDQKGLEISWNELKYKLPKNYLLSVGRMDIRKNFTTVAKVTKEFKKEGLIDGLVIVGTDDYSTKEIYNIMKQDDTLSLVVHLKDLTLPEIQAIYQNAKALVYLSLAEGFGLPLIEAMAMKVPIIASNRTAIPEICSNAAVIVDPDNINEVIKRTREVLTNNDLRKILVNNGSLRINDFNSRDQAKNIIDTYESILNDKN